MEKNKFWGGLVVAVAVFVMLSAMWDARVSLAVSVVALVGLGGWLMYNAKGQAGDKNLNKYNQNKEKEIEESKAKILNLLAKMGKVKNDDVQKMLQVSDSTTTRYLDQLEKEGKITQSGQGSQAFYEIKK